MINENNDDDILDKTYPINKELICLNSESESGTVGFLLLYKIFNYTCSNSNLF